MGILRQPIFGDRDGIDAPIFLRPIRRCAAVVSERIGRIRQAAVVHGYLTLAIGLEFPRLRVKRRYRGIHLGGIKGGVLPPLVGIFEIKGARDKTKVGMHVLDVRRNGLRADRQILWRKLLSLGITFDWADRVRRNVFS